MKKSIPTILLSLAAMTASAQTGAWSGAIEVQGIKIDMVFNLDDTAATLDVPTQGAKGIPAQLTREKDGSLTFDVAAIGASYKGALKGDAIEGTFAQNGMSFPMKLTKGEKKLTRPQTPVPPLPYATEEVTFSNGGATLSGTLTLPEGYGKNTPILIMITGSGLQDRNSAMFGHEPFLVIADALARNGIATLRYDDRGYAKSTGDLINVTTEDLKNDAAAGIALLRKRFKRIGAIGHSEGGTIAMMLAAEHKADFIVSLAGAAASGKEILLAQNRTTLAMMGMPRQTVDDYCQALARGFDALAEGKPIEEAEQCQIAAPALAANYKEAIKQMATPYGRFFLKMAGRDYAAKADCPVLALNGTFDQQVNCQTNLDMLRKALGSRNAKNVVKAEDGLNHLFQHCQTGAVTEYGSIEETFAPQVIDEIIEWIKKL